MTTILLTGATGFIGRQLPCKLSEKGYSLVLGVRDPFRVDVSEKLFGQYAIKRFDLTAADNDYIDLLTSTDVVIHLAGLAHKKTVNEQGLASINGNGTARLVEEAVRYGVQRFIYLSTIKVHGGSTAAINGIDQAVTEQSSLSPQDGYSNSKCAAEQAIMAACSGSSTEFVTLRPPLVYGPGVKANFLRLLQTVAAGIPLPLASLDNCRSLIYVENLCDLVVQCIDHPGVSNQAFVIRDENVSTPGLVAKIAAAFGKPARLFPFPVALLKVMMKIAGKENMFERLAGSLVVDDSRIRRVLGWMPAISMEQGLERTVRWYKNKDRV